MSTVRAYEINEVPLQKLGTVTSETQFTAGTTINRPELSIPGFDGQIEMDGVEEVPAIRIEMLVEFERIAAVRTLFRSDSLVLGYSGSTAVAQLRTITEELVSINDEFKVTIVLSLPYIWLRSPETLTTALLDAASKTVTVWPGLTGKVSDAGVRIAGPFTGLRVKDNGRSFFEYSAAVPAGTWLRFEAATGRAYTTTTDAWSGGTEVTDLVQTGPGPYAFRITESWSTDPAVTRGKLTVTTATRGATTIFELKGRPAYVL
ncbi:hypothetical protein RCH12_002771 [Cryobacterium sp. MP_3.1]|uniref:hypothetical protein n=1 Tax=Cryobacterium sp. MP_3.1 TaxID=3071711 RepID=UPI002E01C56E|nr:hypothetical protein [Cryobacterium sp. MP_3.1]